MYCLGPSYSILFLPSCLSCHGSPVLVVLPQLSCPIFPAKAVHSLGCTAAAVLPYLSRQGCPFCMFVSMMHVRMHAEMDTGMGMDTNTDTGTEVEMDMDMVMVMGMDMDMD